MKSTTDMDKSLWKQLEAFEKKGIDRRRFFKIMAAAGVFAGLNNQKVKASSCKAKR